ncbi:hypothetical protein [Aquibium oceanicum]|uniref:Uncharacterized protein n=1 Tax=Aquibium oceanicum TaxID=1670800 RepID=A0A1L3SPS1_9HYPH|nr:hypothetical protein [Aquibium oceanicum]APH71427.1 hypothetical protein BSQ44_08645 [Aquibium oceanicum]
MTGVPEYSPAMLRLFLRARAVHEGSAARFARRTRKAAKVTEAQFESAWTGRLTSPQPRSRLWGALGLVPADHGVMLTAGGQSFEAGLCPAPQDEGGGNMAPAEGRKADRPSRPVARPSAASGEAAASGGQER